MTPTLDVRSPAHRTPLGAPRAHRPPRRVNVDGATPTPTGMKFETTFGFESWKVLGARLGAYSTASLWWLGDWLDFGRQMYGSRYKLGVELTGLDYQTLRNYASIARRFKLSRRRDRLSFQHHAEVAALSDAEQDEWLDRAEREKWSRNELRRRLRAELPRPAGARGALEPAARVSVEVDTQHPWWQAAQRSDCDLHAWVVRTLDQAADQLLADAS